MGVAFKDLFVSTEINLDELKNKRVVIDSYNLLYQFLTTIRSPDGALLMDAQGNVTSHLVGLFARTTKLLEKGLKLAFVFDGQSPQLKHKERERRKEIKIEAQKEYEAAAKKKDIEGMKKYAARTSRLTSEMVNEAKKLVDAFGLPVIQAPSEGEAQAAHMVKQDNAFAVVSQDFDSLMHNATRLIRNLSILGKRKKTNQLSYGTVKPEMIDLAENLNTLGIDQNQLIALGMLVGTDYNIGGIKGIGPKNALKLVKKYTSDLDALFTEVKWDDSFDYPWTEVYYLIKKLPVTDNYSLRWNSIDSEKIKNLLVDTHNFSEERVEASLSKLFKEKQQKQQKGLGEFF